MTTLVLRGEMWKTPRKVVSDGRFSPEGTISFVHGVSIEGQEARCYADEDLTVGLNGSRERLGKGEGVPVEAEFEVYVSSKGKLGVALRQLREATTKKA